MLPNVARAKLRDFLLRSGKLPNTKIRANYKGKVIILSPEEMDNDQAIAIALRIPTKQIGEGAVDGTKM